MQILYGTTNQAKLDFMKKITAPLGIDVIGLRDLNQPIPDVCEDGNSPLENAKMKAEAYHKAFHIPVFSCDSGLYFDEVEEALQPGLHVRRVNGKELSDEEMIEHYSKLATKYNGRLTARYRNAIYFIAEESVIFSCMDESLVSEPFIIANKAHEKRVKGFPLDSLSVDFETGEYYYDMGEKEAGKLAVEQGLNDFWKTVLEKMKR